MSGTSPKERTNAMHIKNLRRTLTLGLALPTLAFAAPNDAFRGAAQKGVTFLGNDTVRWQKSNNCYGCHVQAVTLEGLSVGLHNQYSVPKGVLDEVLRGILQTPGGARTPGGLTHSGFPRTAKTFGASAFARYDKLVDGKLSDDLLKLAKELIAFQQKDGSVVGDHQSYPVTTGVAQATFQASQTWRQAYARSADSVWLTPLQKAEQYMATVAKGMATSGSGAYLQDLNYTLMGLLAAGASPTEPNVAALIALVEKRQLKDGGWGFGDGGADAFATGQTVYTLKLAGRTEADSAVKRGLSWLVEHQGADGSWGHSGSGRAEAMWAVLGLVSVDVLSLAVSGVTDGEHVLPKMEVSVEAKDNSGAQVKETQVLVDDLPLKKSENGTLKFVWETQGLSTGKHTFDVVAKNAKGQLSRRRFEVFAGDLYLTQLGTAFTNEGTQVTLRNIAPDGLAGQVRLSVFKDDGKDAVYTSTQPSRHGATAFMFGGKGKDGKPLAPGRYKAELAFLDDKGAVRQREETLFVHDTLEAQQARYAEVAGKLDLARDGSGAANAQVELVDEQGKVVQRVLSNEAGNYRFKSVDSGKYKVRVRKDGFKAEEAAVDAKAGAAPAAASVSLH